MFECYFLETHEQMQEKAEQYINGYSNDVKEKGEVLSQGST